MSMKKTDLEKRLAKKIAGGHGATPERYGKGAAKHAKGTAPEGAKAKAVPLALKLLGKSK